MKQIKKKKCVWCKTMFKPFKTTQRACSGSCALAWSRQRKAEQKAHLELFEKEEKDKKKLSSALESTRLIVHEYIRLRDKGKPCISCQASWTEKFQAGHYFKAELYSTLKFYLLNIHGQCPQCNLYLDGNINEYSLHLPERIGIIAFNELRRLAKDDKIKNHKWCLEELKKIRIEVKLLIKQLKQ